MEITIVIVTYNELVFKEFSIMNALQPQQFTFFSFVHIERMIVKSYKSRNVDVAFNNGKIYQSLFLNANKFIRQFKECYKRWFLKMLEFMQVIADINLQVKVKYTTVRFKLRLKLNEIEK